MDNNVKSIIAAVKTLNQMNVNDPHVVKVVGDLARTASEDTGARVDAEFLSKQVNRLASAAKTPAENYARIMRIAGNLQRAVEISRRPQYAAVRPQIASLVERVAGIFAECDTAAELAKHSLDEIESAVAKLYGDQNDPKTYNFVARGKGHHGK